MVTDRETNGSDKTFSYLICRFKDYYIKIFESSLMRGTIDQVLEMENDYITKRLSKSKMPLQFECKCNSYRFKKLTFEFESLKMTVWFHTLLIENSWRFI